MKKTTIAIIIVIITSSFITGQEQSIRVAIAPYDDTSTMENLSLSATNSLTQLLSNSKNIAIRQPDAIQSYINLPEKVQTGFEEPADLKGKAQSVQVDYLAVGSW